MQLSRLRLHDDVTVLLDRQHSLREKKNKTLTKSYENKKKQKKTNRVRKSFALLLKDVVALLVQVESGHFGVELLRVVQVDALIVGASRGGGGGGAG